MALGVSILDLSNQALSSKETFASFLNSELLVEPHPLLPPPPRVYSNWQVLWHSVKLHTISPLRSLFLRYIHPYAKTCIPETDRKIILSLSYPIIESLSIVKTTSDLLFRSLNTYRPGTEGYLQPMPIQLRLREFVEGRVQSSHLRSVKLYSRKGLCRGMCQWFALRYFQSLPTFATPRECILSLAKYFEHGATDGSILLQGVKNDSRGIHQILGMRTLKSFESELIIQSNNQKALSDQDVQKLSKLENGLYYVSILNIHMTLIVKTDRADYIFDPSGGCAEYSKDQFPDKIAQAIEQYARKFPSSDVSDLIVTRVTALSPDEPLASTFTIQTETML